MNSMSKKEYKHFERSITLHIKHADFELIGQKYRDRDLYKRLPRDGFTTHYQGFDSREREELHRCDLILYELISLKQDKTREDNLKLVSIALKCLRDSVTEREKRWWVRELEHHLKNLKGGDSSD